MPPSTAQAAGGGPWRHGQEEGLPARGAPALSTPLSHGRWGSPRPLDRARWGGAPGGSATQGPAATLLTKAAPTAGPGPLSWALRLSQEPPLLRVLLTSRLQSPLVSDPLHEASLLSLLSGFCLLVASWLIRGPSSHHFPRGAALASVWIPKSDRGHGSPPQRACLETPTDRGAWQATVHGAAESQTRLTSEARRKRAGRCPGEERCSLQLSLREQPSSFSAAWVDTRRPLA